MFWPSGGRAPRASRLFLFLATVAVSNFSGVPHAIAGTIVGRAIDPGTGAGVPDVTVAAGGRTATTDLDGAYRLTDVPAGTYVLEARKAGRLPARITEVSVGDTGATTVDVPLPGTDGNLVKMEAFTVSADVVQNSGLGLLSARQKAAAVSDAIGNEQMSRLGFGTAASAMKAVTGASVVGGKYVYMRGLGERYSNTQVNGVEVPSADPDRRAVNMDMFPSDLIDAIVATKTFTPDRPGNFAGGSVDLKTKEFPDQFTVSVSGSVGYNSQVTHEPRLTYPAGDRGLARDDGSRALPSELQSTRIPTRFATPDADVQIGRLSQLFSPIMAPTVSDAPLNRSAALAIGGSAQWLGRKLGYAGSISYDRAYHGYSEGFIGRYERQGRESPQLSPLLELSDTRSEEEALIGALLNLAVQFSPDHQMALNTMFNRSGIDMARRQSGLNVSGGGLTETDFFETRTLRYTERTLDSYQLQGKHLFPAARDLRVNWTATNASSTQEDPDTRFFSTIRTEDGTYFWKVSGLPLPSRYFRDLEETREDYGIDFALPVTSWTGTPGQLKFGGAYAKTEREFSERVFEYNTIGAQYTGDEQAFFARTNVGQTNDSGRFVPQTLYLMESTSPGNSYSGLQRVKAGYAMVDWPLLRSLRAIAGVREETTYLDVRSDDPDRRRGLIDGRDTLPSVNLVWSITDKMNVRAAWTKTIARPNFREIADYTSFEFVGDFFYVGNPDLRRTRIENYDLRWEWFPRRGELFAVSVFHKKLTDPIERGIFTVINSGEFQYQNAPRGEVRGFELEARQRLWFLGDRLGEFRAGANFTYVESEVDITAAELAAARSFDPNAPSTRELVGQSPYVANVDLSWSQPQWGTVLSLYYNVFGERIAQISPPGTPAVFEQPAPTLDAVFSQKFGDHWKVTLSGRNLLNSESHETYEFRGVTSDRVRYRRGVSFSLGVSWTY